MLVDELVRGVLRRAEEAGLELELLDYCAGIRYCYAIISGGRGRTAMGVAYVPAPEVSHGALPEQAEPWDALELVTSTNLLEKALGVAIVNAISQVLLDLSGVKTGDILEHLRLKGDDKVVLVGHIRPLYEALKRAGLQVTVVERDPSLRGPDVLPDTMLLRALEGATVCLATGSCLVNDTVDIVAHFARACRVRALVGPTAQALPKLLHAAGFTHVASIHVTDTRAAAVALRRGGGTRELLRYSIKYVACRGSNS